MQILKFLISLLLFFIPSLIFSQNSFITGKVIDSQSKEPLAFVNILVNNDFHVHQTDIDGIFKIPYIIKLDSLRFSYVGYETFTYLKTERSKNILIELKRKQIQLNEVVIFPGENPAHRIIKMVIQNQDKNNPEKMGSFSYTSYNKMLFSANLDSVKIDTEKIDSDFVEAKLFLEKQYLFLIESVIERKFMYPDRNSEKLVASKVSGFKDPLFVLLVNQMQSFSFYSEFIHIGDKNYLTPICNGSTEKYFFLLEDTLYKGNDSIYVISYIPRKNRNFDGLKGLLYINTNGYAIENVIAEPANQEGEGMAIKIQQKYDFIENKQWFPVQLNSDIIFNNISVNRINLYGEGRSYLQNIVLNPDVKKSEFSKIEFEVKESGADSERSILNKFRTDSLTGKDKRTYQVVDSIGKAEHFDRKMKTVESLISGKIPFKFIDFDINRFAHFNDYEGCRLGLGFHNNYKISRKFIGGGYFAYGFKDKAFKYGGDLAFNFNDYNDISFGVNYFNDVTESGGISFYEQLGFLSDYYFRRYLIKRMDLAEKKEAFIRFSALKYLKADIRLSLTNKVVNGDYAYGINNENVTLLLKEYNFTEIGINLCYSYKEKFIKTLNYKISTGTNYPVLWFNYIKGFNDLLGGEFQYNRYEFKIKKSFYIKSLGTPTFQLQAGYIDGDLPYCNLFNGIGSYRQFTISAPNSFETMRMNEFLSNRYAALFFNHSFGKLLLRFKKFAPEFAVATNICIGDLNNPSKHFNVNIQNLRKGYIESGIQINKIINMKTYGLGVGAFYRYGAYAFPEFKNNIAYKFTLTLYM